MTPEGRVKAKVDALLKKYGVYCLKPVQNGMGAPAVDYHCIVRGHGFIIETKAPGKHLTPRQAETFRRVGTAGGKGFLISDDVTLKYLEAWLIYMTQLKDTCIHEQPFDDRPGNPVDPE